MTIAYAGFEENGDTWLGASISGTGGSFSSANPLSDYPPGQRVLAGLRSYQSTNSTVTPENIPSILDFNSVDISLYDSVRLTIRISSTSATEFNGNDGPDYIRFFTALNGASFPGTADISLTGRANAQWGHNATLSASTPAGTPLSLLPPQTGPSLNNYSTLTITIPDSATVIDFQVIAFNNAGEFWNIDNVELTGTLVPEPSSFATLMGGLGMLCGFQRWRARKGTRSAGSRR